MVYVVQGNRGGGLLWFFIFIIAAIFILMMVSRNPAFKAWLDKLMQGAGNIMTPPPPPVQQQTPPPPAQQTGDGQPIQGGQVYPSAADPHECTTVSDGELEQDGDRKEPQLACGFNYLNTEATGYFKFTGSISDTLSIKLRGPKHGGSTPQGDMCNDIHYFALGGNSEKPFGKQWAHTGEYCSFGSPSIKLPNDTWIGVKAVEYNQGSGVKFESYVENPEGSGWKKVAEYVDDGGTGCGSGAANAYTKSPCSGSQPVSIGFRTDGLKGGGDVEWKSLSVREINPTGGPATTSTPTSTTPASNDEEEDNDNETPSTTTPPATTPACPARCDPLKNAPQSYQACCASGGAGVARSARRAMYGNMISRLGGDNFSYNAYQYRNRDGRRIDSNIDFNTLSPKRVRIGNLR